MSNNNNNIYNLYKLIFNNKFLLNKIFEFIKLENRLITRDFKSLTSQANYEQSDFNWLILNKRYELLFYKIKLAFKFNGIQDIGYENLKLFLEFIEREESKELLNYRDDLLELFYNTNSNEILNFEIPFFQKTIFLTSTPKFDCIRFSIQVGSIKFLKIIYNDIIISKSFNIKEFNKTVEEILDLALIYGNLEIIQYVHKVMKIDIFDSKNAIANSIKSDNRSRVLEYLFNEIKFTQPVLTQSLKTSNMDDLMKLEYQLFKKINKPTGTIGYYPQEINNTFNNTFKDVPFEKIFNFIQCIINYPQTSFFNAFKNDISDIAFKINWLIDYKHNLENSNDKVSIGWFSQMKSIINNLSKSNINSSSSSSSNTGIIEFKDGIFNFEREIKRIFIFNYLFLFDDKHTRSICYCMKFKFIIDYDEYNLIPIEIEKLKDKKSLLNQKSISLKQRSQESNELQFIRSFIIVSFSYGNNKLIQLFCQYVLANKFLIEIINQTSLNRDKQLKFWLSNIEETNKNLALQIRNLSTILNFIIENNISKSVVPIYKLLESIFTNLIKYSDWKISNNFNQLKEIANLLQLYYQSDKDLKLFCSSLVSGDFDLFKYYFNNHKNIFEFESLLLGQKVVESGNLEFIQFLHLHKLGCLHIANLIDYSKNLETAKFMAESLNFKFSFRSLLLIGELNQYRLFDYVFNKLVIYKQLLNDSNELPEQQEELIEIPIKSLDNYYNLKSIKTMVENNFISFSSLNFTPKDYTNQINFQISQQLAQKVPKIKEFISTFDKDINFLIIQSSCQDLIKQFFKQLKSNQNNLNDYNTKISQASLKKIINLNSNYPIKSYIEKKIKDGTLQIPE